MLFGSSGIRRRYDGEFPRLAIRVGAAVAAGTDRVLVGMDTRTTSPLIVDAFLSGLLSTGGSADFCGIAPTPAVAYGARTRGGGCMITASHNPEEFSGLKLFNSDGSSYSRKQQAAIENLIMLPRFGDWKSQGSLTSTEVLSPHIDVISRVRDVPEGLKMVLDCGNGAGSVESPGLLRELGVRVCALNCNPSGWFARPSEPLEENLLYVPEIIKSTGSSGAVVHDGDADRMMAFDNRGRYISGDRLLMLFVKYLGAKKVVTTADASMAIDEIAEVRRTPVGDSYVSEELCSWGDFGGEPSGAWIFPGHSLCPDGPYAAALFCEITGEWDVAAELDRMPCYPVLRESFHAADTAGVLTALGAVNPTEGIRLAGERGWCLIRASGTEPKVRLTAEGETLEFAKEMLRKGRELVARGKKA
ncbi:MAG: phosphopentomutase/phosphoglucosamine mutase [Methanoregulaceae archaeon]|nr:phosphopentomutase/phosphoglucosamine mutase [Methanoregulaceae archaeon]